MGRWLVFCATGLCSLSLTGEARGQLFPVAVGQNFEGTFSFIQPIPADTMGAVGVDHFMELNNDEFNVYHKSDGSFAALKNINQFWVDAGVTPISTPFDPRVGYDPHARRWYAVAVDARVAANNILFAVSDTDDPTQSWTGFAIDSDTDNSNWADFPMLAYNADGVYISTNMPPLSAPSTRTAFFVFPKEDLLQPTPSIANMTTFEDVSGATTGFTPHVAIDDRIIFNQDLEVLSMFDTAAGTVQRTVIHGPPGVVQLLPGGQISVPGAAQPPDIVQPGAPVVADLESNDSRFSANPVLRNNELYAVQTIEDMGLAALRFLRIDRTNNSVLESQVLIDPAGRGLAFPSIAVGPTGEIVITVTGASSSEFASAYAIVGKTSGGVTSFDQPLLLRAGVDNYERLNSQGFNRWGDYSATTLDPADPNTFWVNQMFTRATDMWATQVTELIVPLPNEARWGQPLDGDIDDAASWQTQHGGPPLVSENLVFSRATIPGGQYIVSFPAAPPGTYVNETVSVRQGGVEFDLAGNDWFVAQHLEVGPFQSNPQVTIANGTLVSLAGFVAPGPTSAGHVTLDSAQWDTSDLIIGSPPAAGATGSLPGVAGGTGSVTIQNAAQLNVGGTLTVWEQGTVNLVDGTLAANIINHTAPVAGTGNGLTVNGGRLQVNTFQGNLFNDAGTLAPLGTTDITQDYVQQAAATLELDINGTAPGQFDQLIIGGSALLDGDLDLVLGGFSPAAGDTFDILNAGFIPASSLFNLLLNSTFPALTNVLEFELFFTPTLLTLAVMPELDGDFNADGVVNAADYTIWRDTLGETGPGLIADANRDSSVDIVDFFTWQFNFGAVAPGTGSGTRIRGSVPEPASHAVAMLSCLVWLAYWGHERSRPRRVIMNF